MSNVNPPSDYSHLENNSYVKTYIDTLKGSVNPVGIYAIIDEFCEFTQKSVDELMEEHKTWIKAKLDDPTKAKNTSKVHFLRFFMYLQSETRLQSKGNQCSHNTARQYVFSRLAGLYSATFGRQLGVDMEGETPRLKKGTKDKVWRRNGERIPYEEKMSVLREIKNGFSNKRDPAILLCKVSTGMDDVDLFKVKIKDLVNGYYPELDIIYIEGYRAKGKKNRAGEYFQAFFSSEAVESLMIWLAYTHEKITNIFKSNEYSLQNITNEAQKRYIFVDYTTKDDINKKIGRDVFSNNLKSVCEKLAITGLTPKQIRAFFSTHLKKNKIRYDIVERLMGHKGEISKDYEEDFKDVDGFATMWKEEIEPLLLLGTNGNGFKRAMMEKISELMDFKQNIVKMLVDKGVIETESELIGISEEIHGELDTDDMEEQLSTKKKEKKREITDEEYQAILEMRKNRNSK